MKNIEKLKKFLVGTINKYRSVCIINKFDNEKKINAYERKILKLFESGKFIEVHHKICELMFEMAELGEELWVRIDHIYDEREDSKNESGNFIEISILTPTILEYDEMMFELINEENIEEIYRPYFFHFLIDMNKADDVGISFIKNSDRLNQWYKGSFSLNENEDIKLPGYIEKTASPVIYSGRKLIVIDKNLSKETLEKINNAYSLGENPCSKDLDVQNELTQLIGETIFKKARIYHVGTGNCIYLYGKNASVNKRVIFDIGYHVSEIPKKTIGHTKYPRVARAIRSLRPSCVILSHWDSDHYKGCAYANRKIFECRWIAPNCDDATPNAMRLAKYLYLKGNLLLVNRNIVRKKTVADVTGSKSELKLWMGGVIKKVDSHITKPNRQGIVLELFNKTKDSVHCIMMGDVPYKSFPDDAEFKKNAPYDYMVVPHHGAKMNIDLLKKSQGTKKGLSVVCANRGKERPNDAHEKALLKNGYVVILTEDAKFCIDLNLCKNASWQFRK